MKTKKIILAVALGFSFAANAQWPALLNLNTATDGPNTGVIGVGTNDFNWQSSITSLTGGYTTAKRVATVVGWGAPPASNVAWISYPHACAGTTVQSVSYCLGQDHEEYYKVQVTLTNPGTYALNWTAYADNCIYKMYINGSPFYTAPVAGGSYYTRSGHTTPISGVLTSSWTAGVNTILVHIKSGIDPNLPYDSHTGFMFKATGTFTPGDTWPQSSCCLGNLCTDSQNALSGNYEIPLNDFNFNFPGDGTNLTNKVNIGYNCGNADIGKLNSFNSSVTNDRKNNTDPNSISIYGLNKFESEGTGVGVMGVSSSRNETSNCAGVWGDAKGVYNNIGGNFFARNGSKYNIGVSGVALPPSLGGITPETYNMYPNSNIGVYGAGDPGNTKDGAPGSDWAAWFDGDVYINGTGYYTGFTVISDRKFKKEIKPIENASDLISKLKPSNYFLNTDNEYGLKFSGSKQYGFISQEVEAVLPDLVEDVHKPETIDKTGKVVKKAVDYKSLNYIGFIALLTKGAQEQQQTNDLQTQAVNDLQKQLEEQKQLIKTLSDKLAGTTGINTDNGVGAGFQMSQNEPNPFTHETVVKYTLPQTVANAFMAVYDLSGKQITTFPIDKKGNASITITSEKLSAGIYIYSIVADGKVVDSKRMIVANK